jgi:hypothetical protein
MSPFYPTSRLLLVTTLIKPVSKYFFPSVRALVFLDNVLNCVKDTSAGSQVADHTPVLLVFNSSKNGIFTVSDSVTDVVMSSL